MISTAWYVRGQLFSKSKMHYRSRKYKLGCGDRNSIEVEFDKFVHLSCFNFPQINTAGYDVFRNFTLGGHISLPLFRLPKT